MTDRLLELGLPTDGVKRDGTFIIELANSNEYDKCLATLEKADGMEEVDTDAKINYDSASAVFEDDKFTFILTADFIKDEYKLVVKD